MWTICYLVYDIFALGDLTLLCSYNSYDQLHTIPGIEWRECEWEGSEDERRWEGSEGCDPAMMWPSEGICTNGGCWLYIGRKLLPRSLP